VDDLSHGSESTKKRKKRGAMVAHWGVVVAHWGVVVAHRGAVVAHWGAVVAHRGAVVAHWGAVVAHWGAVVAHSGSSRGSLVATPDCEAAVLGLNPAISPAYRGLPVLRWAAIWDGTLLKAVL
jgi:hypothetical protein